MQSQSPNGIYIIKKRNFSATSNLMNMHKHSSKTEPNTIYFVDGCCGSGKSHTVADYIKKQHIIRPQIIVCETTDLCKEWVVKLNERNIPHDFYFYDEHNKNQEITTVEKVKRWIKSAEFGVMICTQTALFLASINESDKAGIDVWFDEIPDFERTVADKMHEFADLILGFCELKSTDYKGVKRQLNRKRDEDALFEVVAQPDELGFLYDTSLQQAVTDEKNIEAFKRFYNKKNKFLNDNTLKLLTLIDCDVDVYQYISKLSDSEVEDIIDDIMMVDNLTFFLIFKQQYLKHTKDLLGYINNRNYKMYVFESEWKLFGRTQGKPVTTFVAELQPQIFLGWRSCNVISADINFGCFKKLLMKNNITLTELPWFKKDMRNNGQHYDIGHKLDVRFYVDLDGKSNSLNWIESKPVTKRGLTNGHNFDAACLKFLGNKRYILCTNKTRNDKNERKLVAKGEVITNKCVGLNSYSDYKCVVIDGAYNPSPIKQKILEVLGYNEIEIREHYTINALYQVVMRIGIRLPVDEQADRYTIVFVDKKTAIEVMSRFGIKITAKAFNRTNITHINQ